MRKALFFAGLALTSLLVAACTPSRSDCAALGGGASFCLQPTGAVAPFDAQQKLAISVAGQQETVIVQLEVDSSGMRLVGMTPYGQKLLQADYDNREVHAALWPDKRLDPVLLFALIELALWDADSVSAALGDSARLVENEGLREVVREQAAVVSIRYAPPGPPQGGIGMVLHPSAIRLDITSLDVAD